MHVNLTVVKDVNLMNPILTKFVALIGRAFIAKAKGKEVQIVYRLFLVIATYCMYLGFLPS